MTVTDIRCLEDMDVYASETEDPLEMLEQDVFHVLTENNSANPDDPDRGLNLASLLSGVFDQGLQDAAEIEVAKDARVAASKAKLTTTGNNQSGIFGQMDIEIQPNDATLNPIVVSVPGST